MIFPPTIRLYGDPSFRGKCPKEDVELASFFNRVRREHPETYGLVALHPRNEGLLENGQFYTVIKHKAEGSTKGASDIIIPGSPSLVMEMKRQDHTLSCWQKGQIEYLEASQKMGAFACLALGAEAAWEAFEKWTGLVTV